MNSSRNLVENLFRNLYDNSKVVCLVSLFTLLSPTEPASWAKTTPETKIHVTLLGQPCLLEGPYDEATLKSIHSIGPAQLYPNLSASEPSNSRENAKKALDTIRNTPTLPSLLDRYRERLGRRLEAQIQFLESLEGFKKNQKIPPLLKIGKRYLQDRDLRSFEATAKKLDGPRKGASASTIRDLIEQLMDTFNDGIERDPEEEFHRAIKKMTVQYTCSFEESEELNE
jgi:hypothetical protein